VAVNCSDKILIRFLWVDAETETDTLEAGSETESTASYSSNVPELSRGERREVARRTRLSAIVVHETVREEGEPELQRHPGALAWSALAAGLSMGFSLVAQGLIHAYLPVTINPPGSRYSPVQQVCL
jgi:formate-nitrite transporter family protein